MKLDYFDLAEFEEKLPFHKAWFMLAKRKADAKDCIKCGNCEEQCTQRIIHIIQGFLKNSIGTFFLDYCLFHLPVFENIGFGDIENIGDMDRINRALEKGGASFFPMLISLQLKAFTDHVQSLWGRPDFLNTSILSFAIPNMQDYFTYNGRSSRY